MSEAKKFLHDWLEEALEIRGSMDIAPYSDIMAPHQVTEQLTDVRWRLDRVETLLIKAMRAKAALTRALRVAQEDLQIAWDTHVTDRNPSRRAVLTQEYVTGKEKFAEANLATLELRKAERKSLDILSHAEETLDVIRQVHRGLESVRQDLLAQVRAIQVETQLER